VGAWNRQRTLPALAREVRAGAPPGGPGVALRRTLRAEIALGIAALAATGALAGYSPSEVQATGPYSASANLGPARAELTVEPALAGPNEIHLYLSRRWQPVECDEGAHGRRIAAGARHRADRAPAAQGRPGPLRDRRRTARAGRRLDARGRRAGVRLRRVPHPLPGPDQVKEPMRQLIPAAFAALALVAPASAAAHVTIQPSTAPAGGFTRLDVRVPNERDDKGTIKVDVQMPPGFAFASYEPVPGWSVDITKEKLDKADRGRRARAPRADRAHHVDRRSGAGRDHRAGPVPGLRAVGRDAGRRARVQAHLQGAADLSGRRGRALDRPGGRRRAGPDRLTDGRRRGRRPWRPRRRRGGARRRAGAQHVRRRRRLRRLAIAALVVGALGLLAGAGGLITARRARTS
jgi:hypothetical protein